jgi:hypothetical protein
MAGATFVRANGDGCRGAGVGLSWFASGLVEDG